MRPKTAAGIIRARIILLVIHAHECLHLTNRHSHSHSHTHTSGDRNLSCSTCFSPAVASTATIETLPLLRAACPLLLPRDTAAGAAKNAEHVFAKEGDKKGTVVEGPCECERDKRGQRRERGMCGSMIGNVQLGFGVRSMTIRSRKASTAVRVSRDAS